ncbi:MAG: hypothetical protein NXI22_10435 [bacterium]|nr:hypothetical protein [bacterium]
MCNATAVKELPETSKWHGAVSDEDVALVRRRHAEKVEEWLDFADFAAELFALHEKYGIEKGEEGYFAYRKHLRTNYNHKLETYGPTPDPLDEGCECIFCRMHPVDTPENSRRLGQVPAESPSDVEQPTERVTKSTTCRLGQVPAESPSDVEQPTEHVTKSTACRLGQVPAELPSDFEQAANHKQTIKKLGPVPAYKTETYRVRWADQRTPKKHHVIGRHSGPYATIESGSKKPRPSPAYLPTTGEKPWLEKMSGAVF